MGLADTRESWQLFFGSLDDYANEKCQISGLAAVNMQGSKVYYSSGWLLLQDSVDDMVDTSARWDPKELYRTVSNDNKRMIDLAGQRFCIFYRTTRTVCGMSKGRRIGLIVHEIPGGIIVASFHWPRTIDRVFPYFMAFFQ